MEEFSTTNDLVTGRLFENVQHEMFKVRKQNSPCSPSSATFHTCVYPG